MTAYRVVATYWGAVGLAEEYAGCERDEIAARLDEARTLKCLISVRVEMLMPRGWVKKELGDEYQHHH